MNDPSARNIPIMQPFQILYTPNDMGALEFYTKSDVTQQYDWTGWIIFNSYNTYCSGLIEFVCNYECIPLATFKPISGATDSWPGDVDSAKDAAARAKRIIDNNS